MRWCDGDEGMGHKDVDEQVEGSAWCLRRDVVQGNGDQVAVMAWWGWHDGAVL